MPANKDSASSVMEKNSTVITEQVKSLREGAVQNGLKMRLDDDYLYRFLNGHKYDVPCALKAVIIEDFYRSFNYCIDFRSKITTVLWKDAERNG